MQIFERFEVSSLGCTIANDCLFDCHMFNAVLIHYVFIQSYSVVSTPLCGRGVTFLELCSLKRGPAGKGTILCIPFSVILVITGLLRHTVD
jgi:hypothetical protein